MGAVDTNMVAIQPMPNSFKGDIRYKQKLMIWIQILSITSSARAGTFHVLQIMLMTFYFTTSSATELYHIISVATQLTSSSTTTMT